MKTAPTDSLYACFRLAAALALATVGGAGVYIGMVALPAYEVDFAVSRGTAAVPFTMVMFGFAVGGIVIGRVVDRYGLVGPMTVSVIAVGLSYGLAARASEFWTFAALHALIGAFGCAAVFTPLVADISKWFTRRRGLAVAICACGSYVAGAIWPLIINPMIETNGWRYTYTMLGVANVAIMLPLLLMLRRRPVGDAHTVAGGGSAGSPQTLRISPMMLVALLSFAGFGCCTAMAVPQVHMVSLCGDRGYGAARGAEMLSLMLAFGIISRLAFGWISDRIGGLRTILIASSMQCLALLMFLPADTLTSLYIVSGLFGLFQGGIVPSYVLIVREWFPEAQAASRLGVVIFASLAGMAFGGWVSGVIFDFTGSYTTAFINGIGWNLINISIVWFLLSRARLAPTGSPIGATAGS